MDTPQWKEAINRDGLQVKTCLTSKAPIRITTTTFGGDVPLECDALPFVGAQNEYPSVGFLITTGNPEAMSVAIGLPQPLDVFVAFRMLLIMEEMGGMNVAEDDLDYVYHLASGTLCERTEGYAAYRMQFSQDRLAQISRAVPEPEMLTELTATLAQQFRISDQAFQRERAEGNLGINPNAEEFRGYGTSDFLPRSVSPLLELHPMIQITLQTSKGDVSYWALPIVGMTSSGPCAGLMLNQTGIAGKFDAGLIENLAVPTDLFTAYRTVFLLSMLGGGALLPGDQDNARAIAEGRTLDTDAYRDLRSRVTEEAIQHSLVAMPPNCDAALLEFSMIGTVAPESLEREWDAGRLTSEGQELYEALGMRTVETRKEEDEIYAKEEGAMTEFLLYLPYRGKETITAHRHAVIRLAKEGYEGFDLRVHALYVALISSGPSLLSYISPLLAQIAGESLDVEKEILALYKSFLWLYVKQMPDRPENVSDVNAMTDYLAKSVRAHNEPSQD